MKKVAVILMRSGSKGLKNKNIINLNTKPMCFYTIDAALESKVFDEIWISSDSASYLELCKNSYKGKCLYIHRDDKYSKDTTTSYEALENLFEFQKDDFIFALLQVTSPIRKVKHIREAMKNFEDDSARHVVSFCKPDLSRSLFMKIDNEGYVIRSRHGGDYRRQDEEDYIYPNGSIFISTKSMYLEDKTFFTEKTKPYFMEKKYSLDVNDEIDLLIAETILKTLEQKGE